MEDSNQHYITKAYLDKFVHPATGQNVLFPFRKGGGPCRARGTKQLGSAINFYRQREHGELTDRLDEARKLSETLLFSSGKRTRSALSRCIFDDAFSASDVETLHLAASAAFLFCGSPVQIHNTAMQSLLYHQMDLFNSLNTEEVKKGYYEKYGDAAEKKLAQDRQEIFRGDVFVDVGRENWKQLGLSAFQIEENVIQLLLGMKMTVVDCHNGSIFLTSDNPVVRTFPSGPDRLDDEVWFPISYKRGLLWHRRTRPADRDRLGYSHSRAMNRRVIKFSYKFVYSPLSQDWIAGACRQERHDPLLGHYGSLEKVIEHAKPAFFEDGKRQGEIVNYMDALRAGSRLDVVGI